MQTPILKRSTYAFAILAAWGLAAKADFARAETASIAETEIQRKQLDPEAFFRIMSYFIRRTSGQPKLDKDFSEVLGGATECLVPQPDGEELFYVADKPDPKFEEAIKLAKTLHGYAGKTGGHDDITCLTGHLHEGWGGAFYPQEKTILLPAPITNVVGAIAALSHEETHAKSPTDDPDSEHITYGDALAKLIFREGAANTRSHLKLALQAQVGTDDLSAHIKNYLENQHTFEPVAVLKVFKNIMNIGGEKFNHYAKINGVFHPVVARMTFATQIDVAAETGYIKTFHDNSDLASFPDKSKLIRLTDYKLWESLSYDGYDFYGGSMIGMAQYILPNLPVFQYDDQEKFNRRPSKDTEIRLHQIIMDVAGFLDYISSDHPCLQSIRLLADSLAEENSRAPFLNAPFLQKDFQTLSELAKDRIQRNPNSREKHGLKKIIDGFLKKLLNAQPDKPALPVPNRLTIWQAAKNCG